MIKMILLCLLFLIVLTGCDNRRCIKQHNETCYSTTFMKVGEVYIPLSMPYTCKVCDEYEKQKGDQ